jgi:hypothetical protein
MTAGFPWGGWENLDRKKVSELVSCRVKGEICSVRVLGISEPGSDSLDLTNA